MASDPTIGGAPGAATIFSDIFQSDRHNAEIDLENGYKDGAAKSEVTVVRVRRVTD